MAAQVLNPHPYVSYFGASGIPGAPICGEPTLAPRPATADSQETFVDPGIGRPGSYFSISSVIFKNLNHGRALIFTCEISISV